MNSNEPKGKSKITRLRRERERERDRDILNRFTKYNIDTSKDEILYIITGQHKTW